MFSGVLLVPVGLSLSSGLKPPKEKHLSHIFKHTIISRHGSVMSQSFKSLRSGNKETSLGMLGETTSGPTSKLDI